MEIATPICKTLCIECKFAGNTTFMWPFHWKAKHSCFWECHSKKNIDCRTGEVTWASCNDNYYGNCERFSPKE